MLIIDMISSWDFPDADKLLRGAHGIVDSISTLKSRCRRAEVPVIYANDNRGRWRSNFPELVQRSLDTGGAAAAITRALMPDPDDYFVLKPSQSAFFGTPLELLLQHLNIRRIVIVGVASDQCVLSTALDARMRSLDAIVPSDCVASQTRARHSAVLRQFEAVHRLPTTPGPRIRF
ncbi:isochorismatase family cysteine hydrolase [Variovorax ureilyticus]|uniref:Isochorismatase family cysteine hydrolase n=1 Tax=Variovorax ureilyticus TaxID=1836198 RepID=A0ABU8VQE1_9BURK